MRLAKPFAFVRCFKFARDRSGNVGMIAGLAALPLMGMVGLGIDYSYMLSYKWKLKLATDASAVGGVTGVQNYIKAYTGSADPTDAAKAAGVALAQAQFKVNTGRVANGSATPTPTVTVTVANGVVTSQVSASTTVKSHFMSLFGVPSATMTSTATATANLSTYVNIFILIDNSQSMGIGAQQSDQKIIFDASVDRANYGSNSAMRADRASGYGTGCALVCHYSGSAAPYQGSMYPGTKDLTPIVRGLGAKLRIDVAKSAITSAMGQIAAGNVSVAAFTFSHTLVQVYPASSPTWTCQTTALSPTILSTTGVFQSPVNNVAAAQTAIAGVDLQNNVLFPSGQSNGNSFTNGDGSSDVTNAFNCLTQQLKAMNTAGVTPGNGLTPSTPISYVILLTDGVQDSIREAQWSANSPVVDYPYVDDTQPTQTFAVMNNCTNSTNCQVTNLFDSKPMYLQAIDTTTCDPIKALGYTLMTLQVQYIIPTTALQGGGGAATYLFPMAAAITGASMSGGAGTSTSAVSQAMQACASSASGYYSANSPTDIANAATAMFGAIKQVQATRLLQ